MLCKMLLVTHCADVYDDNDDDDENGDSVHREL